MSWWSVVGAFVGTVRSKQGGQVAVGDGRGNRILLVGVVPEMEGLVGTTWTVAVLRGAGALEA